MQRTGFSMYKTIFERISRRQKTPILIGIQLRATSTQKACRFRQNEPLGSYRAISNLEHD